MQKLLIATSNPGKVKQYREHLQDLNLELVSLADLGLGSVEETGKTFEENALLKARTYFEQSALQNGGQGLPCIADDGGLEIEYLNDEPGVYSRRWKTGDESATDQELVDYTLEKMKGVPQEKRTARFRMVMAFVDSVGVAHTSEHATEGYIPLEASRIIEGMPFDAVLYIPRFKKIRSELSKEEHEQINQRVLALNKLKPIIARTLL